MEKDSSLSILLGFVDTAARNRHYAPNTAAGFRAALRLFESDLNEAERSSVAQFSENLDHIYRQVLNRNLQNISVASAETYYRRIKNLLNDYGKYGVDPAKMAEWNRPPRKIRLKEFGPEISTNYSAPKNPPAGSVLTSHETPVTRLDIALRPGAKALVVLPADLTKEDAAVIKALVDASVRLAHG